MPVVIFCAPTKVAPVRDMRQKLSRSGFDSFGVTTTLRGKNQADLPPNSNLPYIMVAALTSQKDIKEVRRFIDDHRNWGRKPIAILDECDELCMGMGQSTVHIDAARDTDNYQVFCRKYRGSPAGSNEFDLLMLLRTPTPIATTFPPTPSTHAPTSPIPTTPTPARARRALRRGRNGEG